MAQAPPTVQNSTWNFNDIAGYADSDDSDQEGDAPTKRNPIATQGIQQTNHDLSPNHRDHENEPPHIPITDSQPRIGNAVVLPVSSQFSDSGIGSSKSNSPDTTSAQPAANLHLDSSYFNEDGPTDLQGHNERYSYAASRAKFNHAQNHSAGQKKSPRRGEDDDAADVPRTKKLRSSLFGGVLDHVEDDDGNEADVDDESHPLPNISSSLFGNHTSFGQLDLDRDDMGTGLGPGIPEQNGSPRDGIRNRMSSMNLSQNNKHVDNPTDGLTPAGYASPSRSPSPGYLNKIANPNPYEFRKNIDRDITGAFIDVDDTGNYDPEEEAKKKQLARARAKERKKKDKQPVQKEKKEHEPRLIARLRFRAFGTVLNKTDCTDNAHLFPDDWSEPDSEEEREREERRRKRRQRTPGRAPQIPIEDPKGLLDDLTGHPVARGCKGCRRNKRGQACTMIAGGTWPCEQCDEAGLSDCEPIVPPKEKGKCNHCAEDCAEDEENYCSFENERIAPHEVCQQCVKAGHRVCIPGIPEDYKYPRRDLDEHMYGPDRPFIDCTNCRLKKKRCSVKKWEDRGPCKACTRDKVGCSFSALPKSPPKPKPSTASNKKSKTSKGKGKAVEDEESAGEGPSNSQKAEEEEKARMAAYFADLDNEEDIPFLKRSPTPEIEMEDAEGRKGTLVEIQTSFAHPMRFNVDTENTSELCNFCSMPLFGFMGHCERKVHMLKWKDGLGYTEIHGGHREDNDESVMCETCTTARIQMIACPNHLLQPVQDGHDEEPLFDDAVELLASAESPTEVQRHLQRWCSMCFSIAKFQCCFEQPDITVSAEDGTEYDRTGCGLALCGGCAMRLAEEFAFSSSAMAAALDQVPKLRGTKDEDGKMVGAVRADVGFLTEEGLMMRCVAAEGATDEGVGNMDGDGYGGEYGNGNFYADGQGNMPGTDGYANGYGAGYHGYATGSGEGSGQALGNGYSGGMGHANAYGDGNAMDWGF